MILRDVERLAQYHTLSWDLVARLFVNDIALVGYILHAGNLS